MTKLNIKPTRLLGNTLSGRVAFLMVIISLLLATAGSFSSIILTKRVLTESVDDTLKQVAYHPYPNTSDAARELPAGSVLAWRDVGQGQPMSVNAVGVPQAIDQKDHRVLERKLSGRQGVSTMVLPSYGADMRVVVAERDGKRVLVAQSTEPVERQIAQLAALEVGAWLISMLLALVACIAFGRRLTRPLRQISKTAQGIASTPVDSVADAVTRRVPANPVSPDEVSEVTAAVNSLLHQVEKALAKRDQGEEALRAFLADVSHELRTPIAVVRSHAEVGRAVLARYSEIFEPARPANGWESLSREEMLHLLNRMNELAPEGQQLVDSMTRIERESDRMGRLVNDLLVLARLDGTKAIEPESIDVTYIALEVIADAQMLGADHKWNIDATSEPAVILGDEDGVRRVITNLVTNARKHTPAGTEVTVLACPEGEGARVVVSDTGPGLPSYVAEAPGSRFTGRNRADSSSNGLGLAITTSLVESMGGQISFESSSEGTRVTIEFPPRSEQGPQAQPSQNEPGNNRLGSSQV